MTDIKDPITIGDRYARATHATNLTPSAVRTTDADVLLAAGMAASGDVRLQLALSLYRMKVNGDMAGLYDVVQQADGWMAKRLATKGNRPLPKVARQALVMKTLQWWILPTCPFCNGHGFYPDESAPKLTQVECDTCHGKGERPLVREVSPQQGAHALWLADRLNDLVLVIHARMSRLLSTRMDEA